MTQAEITRMATANPVQQKGAALRTQIICRRCQEPIRADEVHRVRIMLVNAHPSAPTNHVDKEDDFHQACAAAVFHAFERAPQEAVA